MLRIGLTGNMGSGKTTICKVFETLSIPVFYADMEAKKLFDEPAIREKIRRTFGEGVFTPEGKPDNKALAALVFKDKEKLNQLSSIIHPAVYQRFETWTKQHSKASYCIQEAAILFETGGYKNFNYNILVYAPESMLLERVMKRDGITESQVRERLNNQMNQEDKKKLADFLITNDNQSMVIPQVLALHEKFCS